MDEQLRNTLNEMMGYLHQHSEQNDQIINLLTAQLERMDAMYLAVTAQPDPSQLPTYTPVDPDDQGPPIPPKGRSY